MKYGVTYLISGTYYVEVEASDDAQAQELADIELDKAYEDTEVLLNIIGDELIDLKEIKE